MNIQIEFYFNKNDKRLQNAEELKIIIEKVLNNYDDYKDNAIKGRQHIIETFNWSKITAEYEKILYKTIEKFKQC